LGQVGKFLDQVFIGLVENVRLAVLIAQVERREVFDQVLEQRVRKTVLVGPLGVAEDAVQGVLVGLLDAAHGRYWRSWPGHLSSGSLPPSRSLSDFPTFASTMAHPCWSQIT
jgi:hypothetical protein